LKSLKKNKVVLPNISTFSLKGIKPIYCITFENGVEVYLTSNHKVLAEEGWIKISEVNEHQKIYSLVKSLFITCYYGVANTLIIKKNRAVNKTFS
jgi:intein/homing endonuclease